MPLPAITSDKLLEPREEPRTSGLLYYVLGYDDLLATETQLVCPFSQAGDECEIGRSSVEGPPERKKVSEKAWAFTLADPFLSGKHAKVHWTADGCFVQDLGSKHGTFVHGERVAEPRRLVDGDVLEMGHSMFVFRQITMTEGARALSHRHGVAFGPTKTFCLGLLTSELQLRRIAATREPVLILGETGTGKEIAAEYIHQRSKRSGALVAVDCGALSPSLLESELFGHKRGAFTGATEPRVGRIRAAQGGTLFLDEIGNLSETAQAVLLRVMQENKVTPVGADQAEPVDVRYVAATNAEVFASDAKFRADLRARLSGYVLRLPPLRERREDLGVLTAHFLEQAGVEDAGITVRAARLLFGGKLAGNIRGLKQAITTAAMLVDGRSIDVEHLSVLREERAASAREKVGRVEETSVEQAQEAPEKEAEGGRRKRPKREVLEKALAEAGGKQAAVARMLNVPERQLIRWMDAYQMPRARKGR